MKKRVLVEKSAFAAALSRVIRTTPLMRHAVRRAARNRRRYSSAALGCPVLYQSVKHPFLCEIQPPRTAIRQPDLSRMHWVFAIRLENKIAPGIMIPATMVVER